MDYKERLVFEFRELVRKRALLEKQIECEKIADNKMEELIKQQYEGMTMYEESLYGRILMIVRGEYK